MDRSLLVVASLLATRLRVGHSLAGPIDRICDGRIMRGRDLLVALTAAEDVHSC